MKASKFFLSTLVAAAAMTSSVYAETYTVTGNVKQGSDASTLATNGGTIGGASNTSVTLTSADTVTFVDASGYLPGWDNGTFVANIQIGDDDGDGDFTWNDGSSTSTKTITFTGNLSGAGNFIKQTSSNNKRQSFVFSGNVSGFSGDFLNNEGTVDSTLTFGGGSVPSSTTNISGTGTINWAGQSVVYNYSGTGLTVGNTSITAANLEFKGGADYVVSSAVTGNNTTAASNNTLKISAGSVTFNGAVSNFGNLNVAAGATATFAGSAADFTNATIAGAVTVAEDGSLTLGGTVSLASAIQNSGTVTLSEGLKIDLSGYASTDGTYTIISGGTISANGISEESFSGIGLMRGGEFSVESTSSLLTFTVEEGTAGTITWAGSDGKNTWNTDINNTNWTIENGEGASTTTSFFYKDNVVFDSTATNKTVALANGADLTVGTATIKENQTYGWTTNANESATISGTTLTIESGATLELGNTALSGTQTSLVELDFETISLKGTLKNNTNANTSWSTLSFDEEGAFLYLKDIGAGSGANNVWGLGIEKTIVNTTEAVVSGKWGGNVSLGALSSGSNESSLVLKSATDDDSMKYYISDLSGYSGTLTLESVNSNVNGNVNSKVVTATITDVTKVGTSASIVVGSNTTLAVSGDSESTTTLNLAGTGTVAYSGGLDSAEGNYTGDGSVATLKIADISETSTFTGTLMLSGVQLNMGGNTPSDLGKVSKVVLNNAALHFANTESEFSKTLEVAAESTGYIRSYGYNKIADGAGVTISGDVTGNKLVSADDGDVTFSGSVSLNEYVARKQGGISVFSGTATITTLNASGGTANISGTASVGTLNISGGTVNLETASWSSPTTINLTANGATLNFKKSGKSETTYTVGEISTTSVDNFNRSVTVDEGVTVNATSLNNGWGMKSLTVNGVLDLGDTGVLKFATGNQADRNASTTETNVITGTGTIKANELSIGNVGHYQFQGGIRLEIGSGGITAIGGSGNGRNWGHATLAVAKTWTNTVSHGFTLTDATNGTTIEVANAQTATLSGVFSGSGMLIKDGAGTLTLSGTNTYTGGTTISAGTLIAGSASALGDGDVVIESGAKLQANAAVVLSGDLVLTVSDSDKEGTGTGFISGDGSIAFADTEEDEFDLYVDISNLTLSDAESVALKIATSGTNLVLDDSNSILVGKWDEDAYWVESTEWKFSTFSDEGVLTLVAIPEPSAFGLLAGVGALALVAARRRRRS